MTINLKSFIIFSLTWKMTNPWRRTRTHTHMPIKVIFQQRSASLCRSILSVYSFDLYSITNIAQGISLRLWLAWNPACGTMKFLRVFVCTFECACGALWIAANFDWQFSKMEIFSLPWSFIIIIYIFKIRSIQYLDVLYVMSNQWRSTTYI